MSTPARSFSYVKSLDGLRGVAICLVFLAHASTKAVGGWLGVEVFFTLSGYLITSIMLAELENTGNLDLRRFYMRRALRLTPALVVMVAIVGPFAVATNWGQLGDVVAALLYLNDVWPTFGGSGLSLLSHTWSLAVEEQFYLVWPVCLVLLCRRPPRIRAAFIAGTMIAAVVGTILAHAHYGAGNTYKWPVSHEPALGFGVLLAFARSQGVRLPQGVSGTAPAVLACGALLVGLFTLNHEATWLFYGGYALVAVPAVVLVAHIAADDTSVVTRLLSAPLPVWLGKRSYGIYLWHFPILTYLLYGGKPAWVVWTVGLLGTYIASVLSWRLVEQPFLQRKKRYRALTAPAVPIDVRSQPQAAGSSTGP